MAETWREMRLRRKAFGAENQTTSQCTLPSKLLSQVRLCKVG
jgi:hypothetical protein